jgi:hypothetical protein
MSSMMEKDSITINAAVVMIFEAKGCMAWCPKRLQDEDVTTRPRTTA